MKRKCCLVMLLSAYHYIGILVLIASSYKQVWTLNGYLMGAIYVELFPSRAHESSYLEIINDTEGQMGILGHECCTCTIRICRPWLNKKIWRVAPREVRFPVEIYDHEDKAKKETSSWKRNRVKEQGCCSGERKGIGPQERRDRNLSPQKR